MLSKTGRRLTPRYQRIIDLLTAKPKQSANEIAEAIHCVKRNALQLLKSLKASNEVHIGDWKVNEGKLRNHSIGLWVAGPGEDAPKPKPLPNAQVQRNRIKRLKEQYGKEDARKILRPRSQDGSDILVRDGKATFRRGKARGIRQSAAA